MTTLYIIGNGFDLWHGLPTSYGHFYEFAKAALDELEKYFRPGTAKDGPWCDFENCLGTFNCDQFYNDHDNTDITSESFKPSHVYALEDDLKEQADHLIQGIREQFYEWVDGIEISPAPRKMVFDCDARYLTFNYTSALQLVYGIDDASILHIHGSAKKSEQLVFGHGEEMQLEPELDENGDSNRTMFSDAEGAAKYPFFALKKPIDDVISRNLQYFESLSGITEIVVIGQSLNNVDLPYFKEIAKRTMGRRWTVFCYQESEKEHYLQQLLKCEISKENILCRRYEST